MIYVDLCVFLWDLMAARPGGTETSDNKEFHLVYFLVVPHRWSVVLDEVEYLPFPTNCQKFTEMVEDYEHHTFKQMYIVTEGTDDVLGE